MLTLRFLRALYAVPLLCSYVGAQTLPATAPDRVPEDDPDIRLPPITIQLENGSPQALAEAFSTATGTPFYAMVPEGPHGALPTVSLIAVNQPYWQVIDTLNQNSGVFPKENDTKPGTGLRWNFGRLLKGSTWNGFILYPDYLERSMLADPQSAEHPTDELHISVDMMIDPRIKLVGTTSVSVSSMIDEHGADLAKGVVPEVDIAGGGTHSQQFAITMPFPVLHGQMIASLKGVVHVQLPLESRTFVLKEPEKHLKEEQTFEGQSFLISGLQATDKGLDVAAYLWPPPEAGAARRSPIRLPIQLDVADAGGKHTFCVIDIEGLHAHIDGKGPFQISAIIATRTRQVDVPFELKDLALPK